MILVRLKGGLGNQMFQYAFAKSLQLLHRQKVFLDISELNNGYRRYELHHFNTTIPIATESVITYLNNYQRKPIVKIKNKLLPYYLRSYVVEPFYHFDKNLLKIRQTAIVEGYFQSEKYFKFKPVEEAIRSEFTLKQQLSDKSQDLLRQIIQTPNAIGVHIRRGDYVGNPLHPVQEVSYFDKAISKLKLHLSNFHFFIFSNDIDWCKANWKFPYPTTFVENAGEANAVEDFSLMMHCKHNIIANSSFSWWAAWLNPNPNKIVIAPKQWVTSNSIFYRNLNDIIPEQWIKI